MFKTILKTLAVSATALTSLSACGTLADLNALNNLNDPNAGGAFPAFAPLEISRASPDVRYAEGYPGLIIDTRLCYDCEILNEKALDALEADLIAKSERFLNDYTERETAHLEKKVDYYLQHSYGLSEESRLAEENRIAAFAVSEKAKIAPSAKRFVAAVREMSIRRANLSAEQYRWDASESSRVTYEPSTTVARTVSITRNYEKDSADTTTTSATTNDAFNIISERKDVAYTMTINGVNSGFDSQLVDIFDNTSQYIKNHGERYDTHKANLFGGPDRNVNIRDVVNGTHPTIQGDYFGYRSYPQERYQEDRYTNVAGIATIGIQTDAAVVESQTAVAIYRGEGFLGTREVGEGQYVGLDYNRYGQFVINMTVDFDGNTIEGIGRGTPLEDYGFSDDKITFNSAPIVGNGFEGTFNFDSGMREAYDITNNPTGQYSGNFFGPNADDLAGVMSFDATALEYDYTYVPGILTPIENTSDINVTGIGGFRADRTVIPNFEE